MNFFLDTIKWLLRTDGAFLKCFLPSQILNSYDAAKYVSRRLVDMIQHRMMQGKQHDHVSCPPSLSYHPPSLPKASFRGNSKR